jgi:glycosyltransferase involved in cell wall biosynthesis
MKLLFLINEFGRGGAERVVSLLLQHLPTRLPDSKFSLYLLDKSEISYPLPKSIEIYIASKRHHSNLAKFLNIFALARKVKKYIKENNIDIVISFLTRANYVNVLSKLYGAGHETIISERNTPGIIYNTGTVSGAINRLFIRRLYARCDKIIAVSTGVKNDLEKNFNIPPEIIEVIYNPFDSGAIEKSALQSVEHRWLGKNGLKTVISLGRLEKQKNHQLLLNAFCRTLKKIPQARLIIIGEGRERSALTRLSRELKIDTKIDLIGQMEDPFPYLARADLFVLSSIAEGFPNALVEAMICACPVISTDCPSGPNEIIINKDHGILVPLNNAEALSKAMIMLLNDETLRINMKKNAKKRSNAFALKRIINQYADLLMNTEKYSHN